ncbi:two-component system, NtrC family, nitrogen regulation sensor histidine kinase NtrY [Jannaschia helgolandensis]|uniref:histidine kinase n=2 Tax=Jannaschia helgolandensis TaxID=188906 RepID=A0A1H7KT95_9RHOB|nr:two-component system, NtrC family, nitrogen regulation sensor histidine kinase NtrY [Jannaschia helgolandensis]
MRASASHVSPVPRAILWSGRRQAQAILTVSLVVMGPVLVVLTFLSLGLRGPDTGDLSWLRAVLLADLVYILAVAALVVRRVTRMIAARRNRSAGSQLHLRLTGVFTGIALIPTILTAVFATVTINIGLEGWFSDRVRNALGNSVEAAQAYAQEHRDGLTEDARALAGYLNVAKRSLFFMADGDLRQVLAQGQELVQRGLAEAFVVDGAGEIRARGDRSYLFDFVPIDPLRLQQAAEGSVILMEDKDVNEFRALLKLTAFNDRYLYVSRTVDGDILQLLDETRETAKLYQQLEQDRGRLLFEFGLLYLGFALILILAATWAGMWFAERLSRPVGRLAGAAQRVGQGDLSVRVKEEAGDDEIAMLGRIFNQMTRQLKGQRDALVETNMQTERRRRLFDSVLGSVTAGVIGLDPDGKIDFMNRSAQRLLGIDGERYGVLLDQVVPEFTPLFERLRDARSETMQEEIRLARGGRLENLLVRIATRPGADGAAEGYVVAFDDVTELVSAQRMAAWGDVARRIAHEIKNPLTPIQLSAERLKRRFTRELEPESAEKLGELTDVIVRQTNDLRRIVDEFSKFARMPEPERRRGDLAGLLRETVMLQRAALDPVEIVEDIPAGKLQAEFDQTMMGQAFTNLIKNAGEAIETRVEKTGDDFDKRVGVSLINDPNGSHLEIRISDNGIGLPEDRAKLFEPYVTTRDKGTGLGLPIVKKIIEEHGGTLELADAAPDATGHTGAEAVIRLPRIEES